MFVHVCNRREDGANAAIDTSETEDDESLVDNGCRAGIESGKMSWKQAPWKPMNGKHSTHWRRDCLNGLRLAFMCL